MRCPRLVLRGVDRANGEEFTVLTDRQFAYAATFVSWVDLDEVILRVDGWGREEGPCWVVKHTTNFFVSDTRELGVKHREQQA